MRLGVVGLVAEMFAAANAALVGTKAVKPAVVSSSAVRLEEFVRAVKVVWPVRWVVAESV